MENALPPPVLARRLAEVYAIVGPIYRRVARIVEGNEPVAGMSVGVRAVLDHLLRDGEQTVPQLAREQALSRQFVQRMVNDAVVKGYVELFDNPAHRRSRLVRLLPRGEAAIRAVHSLEHELMSRVRGDLTSGELDATLRVLRHMLDNLEDIERDRGGD